MAILETKYVIYYLMPCINLLIKKLKIDYFNTTIQKRYLFFVLEKQIKSVELLLLKKPIIIKNIGVNPEYRNKKIGSALINNLSSFDSLKNKKILAETDNEAVKFYEKIGFSIKRKEIKDSNMERYICEKEFNIKN